MGDVEPRAAGGFLLGGAVGGLREDGDAAGAGAGGEVVAVAVDDVEERYDRSVHRAFRRLVRHLRSQ